MSDSPEIDDVTPERAGRLRIPLAVALVGGVTLLLLVAVGSVLWITLSGARDNTFALVGERATTTLDLIDHRLEDQLAPVAAIGTELAAQFADGRLDLGERRQRSFDAFAGILSALPQLTAVLYVPANGPTLAVARQDGRAIEIPPGPGGLERERYALEAARTRRDAFWTPPLWVPVANQAVVSLLAPVWRGEDFLGVVVAPVTLDRIARLLAELEREQGVSAFILYDGDRILGHPRIAEVEFAVSGGLGTNPLPHIDSLDEPAFRLIEGAGESAHVVLRHARDVDFARADDDIVVLARAIGRYDATAWTIGVTMNRVEVGRELERLRDTAIVGLAILVVAVAGGFMFARMLNRQIGRLVGAATTVTRLDLDNAPHVPDSRVRELSDAAHAFNAMIGALRWFETYVPKELVLRLMREGEARMQTEERELTIMFTDIHGFSTLAEHMGADEIAAMLNAHFAMLGNAIEDRGGTVDKFIGDAIMAFWGAPEPDPDHARHALDAAAEIQRMVAADNAGRRADGKPPLRVRVGVHTGRVVVGNIGSRSRVNYTVVGDTVNTASRIDAIAKEIDGEEDCVVLLSGEAADRAGPAGAGYTLHALGAHDIRGREGMVTIYRLDARDTA